jgi:hypothetical protein
MTTTLGLTDFNVLGWSNGAWITLATVTGNNLVKRTVTFPAVTTNQIRIHITKAVNESRLAEVEAWTPAATGGPAPTTTLTGHSNIGEIDHSTMWRVRP